MTLIGMPGQSAPIDSKPQFELTNLLKKALGKLVCNDDGSILDPAQLDSLGKDFDRLNSICQQLVSDGNLADSTTALFVQGFLKCCIDQLDPEHAGAAALQLGSLNYGGAFSARREPDYQEAVQWYRKGDQLGNLQATINLGYCYEYGRTGQPDPDKAYECYHRAALGSKIPEAQYKLGDMYRWGKGVKKDREIAFALYDKAFQFMQSDSFDYEQDAPEIHASILHRLADLIWEANSKTYERTSPDLPLTCLSLYQEAERSYHRAIRNGLKYYRGNLEKVIDAQEQMRLYIDPPLIE